MIDYEIASATQTGEAPDALNRLLRCLKSSGYQFTTITPATHARVLARPLDRRPNLRDIFGWSRGFRKEDLDPELLGLLTAAGGLREQEGQLRSAYRVSSLGENLFLHSAYPTQSEDSIFFGPDTYRFARFIRDCLPGLGRVRHIVDMGTGSGAGGIVAAKAIPDSRVTLVDMNPEALRVARINAQVARVDAEILEASEVPAGADLVLANPPYMIDARGRAYRDGGGLFGGEVALEWAKQALAHMQPHGSMLLYTGAAIVDGRMPLQEELEQACARTGANLSIEEIDPDVFGEELEQPPYAEVERIALVGAIISVPA